MQRPNLFDHARSELTQDAFLAWLLGWADPQFENADPVLNRAGGAFLKLLLEVSSTQAAPSGQPVRVKTQERGVDILVEVGDDLVILIEDKVDAGVHGDQLTRYRKWAEDKYAGKTVVPVLLTVGEHSSLRAAEEGGWAVLRRREILALLREHAPLTENAICQDFLEHLDRLDTEVRAYRTRPPADWRWRAWTGFYEDLQQHLNGATWEYVHTGDFLALSWGWWRVLDGNLYLQLQRSDLALRVVVDADADQRAVRGRLVEALTGPESTFGLKRPGHLGLGKTMAVAVAPEYRQIGPDGLVDMAATIDSLRRTERLINEKLGETLL